MADLWYSRLPVSGRIPTRQGEGRESDTGSPCWDSQEAQAQAWTGVSNLPLMGREGCAVRSGRERVLQQQACVTEDTLVPSPKKRRPCAGKEQPLRER